MEPKSWQNLVRTKKHREIKERLQDEWRPRIFDRDNFTCRVCGSKEGEHLHLAHITPITGFLNYGSDKGWSMEESMRKAYTEDNLVTLCSTCHDCYHRPTPLIYSPQLLELIKERDQMREKPVIKRWLKIQENLQCFYKKAKTEGRERKSLVKTFFSEKKKERGWVNARDKLGVSEEYRHKVRSVPELQKNYDLKRKEIVEKHNLQEIAVNDRGSTIWTGSNTPIIFEGGLPVGFRLYPSYYRWKVLEGQSFLLPPPHDWANPILKELWEAYKEYRKIKGAEYTTYPTG